MIFITEVDCVLCEVRAEADKQLSSSAIESDPTLELSKDYEIQNINRSKDVLKCNIMPCKMYTYTYIYIYICTIYTQI
jgi:rRNA maturation endonuclease Nob1